MILGTMLVAVVPSPAGAFHDPGMPVLSAFAAPSAGWAAWKVTTNGGSFGAEAWATLKGSNMASIGVYLLKGDGSPNGAAVLTSWGSGQVESHVEVPAVGQILDLRGGSLDGVEGLGVTWGGLPAGTYDLVAIVSQSDGAVTGAHWRSYAESAVLDAASTGTNAFLLRDPDFHGTLNVYENAGVSQPAGLPFGFGVRAKAIVDGSATTHAGHRLFALFESLGGNPVLSRLTKMDYTGPDGNHAGSTAYFIQGGAQGDYTFHVAQNADTSGIFAPVIWATGADVALP